MFACGGRKHQDGIAIGHAEYLDMPTIYERPNCTCFVTRPNSITRAIVCRWGKTVNISSLACLVTVFGNLEMFDEAYM